MKKNITDQDRFPQDRLEKVAQTPVSALPKGGGAIAGMGETFSVAAETGSSGLAIPLPTSPGRMGWDPGLIISYSSNNGNGPFGLGWSINLPSIKRKTSKGIPRYTNEDIYTASDMEDLVPKMIYNEGTAVWEPDTYETTDYHISRYRPRIESGFSRIERWVRKSDGDVHWRTRTGANVEHIYGQSSSARVTDPDDSSKVFEWLIEQSDNSQGQFIQYNYKAEDSENIDRTSPSESPITKEKSLTKVYPKSVRYGNKTHGDTSEFHFTLIFDYGEHTGFPASFEENPANTWPVRADAFSTFRPGFEVRTYRLCRRILMFHEFDELGPAPHLVRSLEFDYDENKIATTLSSAQSTAYEFAIGVWNSETFPPLSFTYQEASPAEKVNDIEVADLENLSGSVNDTLYQWADLEGQGLEGILLETAGEWFYKPNLGAGSFGPAQALRQKPGRNGNSDTQKPVLADIDGDGLRELLVIDGNHKGYYDHLDEGWDAFRPFNSSANIDSRSPASRMIDLTGDGAPDIAIIGNEDIQWFRSLEKEGFDFGGISRLQANEAYGPRLVFSNPDASIFLADMSGDSMTDLVRIRNGEICYWPNMGYGKFGRQVLMENVPRFDRPERFDTNRIRLADINGTGIADILYIGHDKVRFWLNQSGNGLAAAQEIVAFPDYSDLSTIEVRDLLGKGTACLVWSTDLPADQGRNLRYVDLMAEGKPYLMTQVDNHTGGKTILEYAASTQFYLEDLKVGKQWITRLPYPVQVVRKSQIYDEITGTKYVSQFAYHHGYFDGIEKEFRGFGMVEKWDTDNYPEFSAEGEFPIPTNADETSHIPPIYTKAWYHTGCYLRNDVVSDHFRAEYFDGDGDAFRLPESILEAGMTAEEQRQAYRALKGAPLRTETYGLDGSAEETLPYSISEGSMHVLLVQPKEDRHAAVFQVIPRESLSHNYDRDLSNPRVSHSMILSLNEYGVPLSSIAFNYPARIPIYVEQSEHRITLSETDFIQKDTSNDYYRLNVPYAARSYEVSGISLPTSGPFQWADMVSEISGATEIPFDGTFNGAIVEKRLLSSAKLTFFNEAADAVLPPGECASHGLTYQSFNAVFNNDMIDAAFNNDGNVRVDATLLAGEGKYIFEDGLWWAYSGTSLFDPTNFYRLESSTDIYGQTTTPQYDAYSMMVESVTDPMGLVTSAKYDYRMLAAYETCNVNGNRSTVAFDTRGVVIATAMMGKVAEVDPKQMGDTLADPTTRFEYDIFRWENEQKPNYTHTYAREQHGATNPRWQKSYSYFGGTGQRLMVKVQAEPGEAYTRDGNGELLRDGTGQPILAHTETRWIGNGRTIVNNKGLPVRSYEPYFSSTWEYEDEAELVETGISPVVSYDALGRAIRTDLPNGTFTKVEFTPWMFRTYDPNDTVLESDWYADLGSSDPGDPEPADAQQRAAWLAAAHADTPVEMHLDTSGRVFLAIRDNGADGRHTTKKVFDFQGNTLSLIDAQGRTIATSQHAMGGAILYTDQIETGIKRTLSGGGGQMVRSWENNIQFRVLFDSWERAQGIYAKERAGPELLLTYTVFSDILPSPENKNLEGLTYMKFDQSGMIKTDDIDFKGNIMQATSRITSAYKTETDYSPLIGLTTEAAINAEAASLLDDETFTVSNEFDALNRPIRSTLPNGAEYSPTYNEANRSKTVAMQIPTEGTARTYVTGSDYNAMGQRLNARLGNNSTLSFTYDDLSRQITRILTEKDGTGDIFQDLNFIYDPVGNLTQMYDDAQQTLFFQNMVIHPEQKFQYDAIYRLTNATGREQAGLVANTQRSNTDIIAFTPVPHSNDAAAVRNYEEHYTYDETGNILSMRHIATGGSWTRYYNYDAATNRLLGNSLPGDGSGTYSAVYSYDSFGKMTSMPHLADMKWNTRNQLSEVDLGGGGTAWYVYGASGMRNRKVVEKNGKVYERLYFGPLEYYRKKRGGITELERHTQHVYDSGGKICTVITTITDTANPGKEGSSVFRYQYGNNIGSASLELDENANLISYEEYHPYGTSSYRSGQSETIVSLKRYRYIGMERDDETGLSMHGVRYYVTWLGRWTSPDPAGFVDGPNLYRYARNNPIAFSDANGMTPPPNRVTFSVPEDLQADITNPDEAAGRRLEQHIESQPWNFGGHIYRFEGHIDWRSSNNWFYTWERWEEVNAAGEVISSGVNADTGGAGGTGLSESPNFTSDDPPAEDPGADGPPGSGGIGGPGSDLAGRNPTGPTLEVPNNFDPEKVSTMVERVRTDRGVGIRGEPPGGGSRTADIRAADRPAVRALEPGRPPGMDIDHTVELQHIIRGSETAGADTVRVQDHRYQTSSVNQSQGPTAMHNNRRQIAAGFPEDVPAGGVARTSEMGRVVNRQWFRTGARHAGHGLMVAGPILSAWGASQVGNSYVQAGGYSSAGVEAVGTGMYFYGRYGRGGANGFQAGRALMSTGGRLAMGAGGVGQFLISGYMAYEDAQRGDWVAFGFDSAAAVGGIALLAAATIAAGTVAAPFLVAAGIVTGVAAGVFHLGRYFDWW